MMEQTIDEETVSHTREKNTSKEIKIAKSHATFY